MIDDGEGDRIVGELIDVFCSQGGSSATITVDG
jgi:hypothetical protein